MQIKKAMHNSEMSVNIASKPATRIQGYTMTKKKHLTSLKAVRVEVVGALRDLSNLKITGHALPAKKLPYRTHRIVSAGLYIDSMTALA